MYVLPLTILPIQFKIKKIIKSTDGILRNEIF